MAVAGPFNPVALWECDPEVFFRIVERLSEASKKPDRRTGTRLDQASMAQMMAELEEVNGR